MTTLARKLRVVDYFTLGWGTMVGVGWLVVMDDWLLRGGPLGGVLGFAIGGALLLPIGYVYGQLVTAMPDAAGEVAYTAKVFPRSISFATGWMMVLAYFIVCPWEAVAVGKIASYIFPGLDSMELYRIAGRPVYLPHVIIGLGLTGLLTWLNFRGIRLSAIFQNWTTFGTLGLFVVFVAVGISKGSPQNLPPLFTHSGFVSVLLVIQIVPYFMTGFESVVKGAEESRPEFRSWWIFQGDLDGHTGGHFVLHHRDCRRGLCGSMAGTDRRKIHDRGGLPTCGGLALDCQRDSGGGAAFAFQSV